MCHLAKHPVNSSDALRSSAYVWNNVLIIQADGFLNLTLKLKLCIACFYSRRPKLCTGCFLSYLYSQLLPYHLHLNFSHVSVT